MYRENDSAMGSRLGKRELGLLLRKGGPGVEL